MKKPNDFRKLSDVVCSYPGCKRRIKQNVVDRKPNTKGLLCYTHYKQVQTKRGNVMK